MEDPTITAIIPLYNGAEFIEAALNSVLAQTLKPESIIVVDDGSTDIGPDIVAAMTRTHDISLIRKPNGGQSSARNLGISHSATSLIALLDQDDIWYPNHLEELIKPFREVRYPELGWVYSNLDEIDRDGRMVTRSCLDTAPRIRHPKRSLRACLATDMFILPTSALISRRAFDAVGGFDERLIGYEDDDLFQRMFRHGFDNVYLRQALAKWRIFPHSTSHSPQMRLSRMTYVGKLLATFPPDRPPGYQYWRELLVPRFLPMLLQEYLHAPPTEAARRAAVDDLKVLLPYLPGRSRFLLGALMPLMTWKATAGLAANLASSDLPLLRRLIRRGLRLSGDAS